MTMSITDNIDSESLILEEDGVIALDYWLRLIQPFSTPSAIKCGHGYFFYSCLPCLQSRSESFQMMSNTHARSQISGTSLKSGTVEVVGVFEVIV